MNNEPVRTTQGVIEHYGIKGMRWGVRRKSSAPSGPTLTSSYDARRAISLATKVRKGGSKVLSNKEMQDLVNRMNLEQQYKKLQGAPPESKQTKAIKIGKQIAANMIAESAKAALPGFIQKKAPQLKPLTPLINQGIDNIAANANGKKK